MTCAEGISMLSRQMVTLAPSTLTEGAQKNCCAQVLPSAYVNELLYPIFKLLFVEADSKP